MWYTVSLLGHTVLYVNGLHIILINLWVVSPYQVVKQHNESNIYVEFQSHMTKTFISRNYMLRFLNKTSSWLVSFLKEDFYLNESGLGTGVGKFIKEILYIRTYDTYILTVHTIQYIHTNGTYIQTVHTKKHCAMWNILKVLLCYR